MSAGAATSGGIRYDAAQSLTDTQKTQAQTNIGLGGLLIDFGFSGTGRRIKGDFSNITHSNRVLVQTSTANAATHFGLIPEGSGNLTRFYAYAGSDPDNASFAQLAGLSTEARITSGKQGTGSYLPFTVWVNNGEVSRWATSGNLLVGTSTDNGTDKLQVNGSISATQFNGGAAGLTGLKTVNGNSILGTGDITITAPVSSFNTRTGAITLTSGDVTGALGFTPENSADKNAANGYAGLDSSGKVAAALLPSYVDDVIEGADLAAFPGTGETGKIYVALDTNKTYRWSGSVYIEVSPSPGSTDSLTEGSVNLYFTQARARAAVSASGSLSYNASTGVFSYSAPTVVSAFTNDAGYLTGITSTQVTTALGFTPANVASLAAVATSGSYNDLIDKPTLFSGAYADLTGKPTLFSGAYADLTGKPTNVSSFTNDAGYLTGITSSQVTTALGFTPYSAANPDGYITSSDLSPYLTSATAASTYQTQAAMSSYLTTASASSTYLPLAGGTLTGDLTFGGTNQRIIGDFTSTTRLLVQTSSANSNTVFGLIPSGTAVNSQFHVWGAADITNAPLGAFTINSSSVQIQSSAAGTGTILPFRVLIGATEAIRIDATTQNLLIGTSTDSGNGDRLQVNGPGRFSGQVGATNFRIYGGTGNVFNGLASGSSGLYANMQNGLGALQVGRDDSSGSQWGIANANAVWGTGAYPLVLGVNAGEAARFNPTTRNFLVGTSTDDATNKLQVAGGVMLTDNTLTRAMLKDSGYAYYNSGTTNALDFTNGSHQRWAPATGAQTLSITNWPPSGNLGELLIEGVSLGAATITWPTVNWVKSDGTTTTTFASNGVTLQTSGTDWVYLWTRDAGTTIYGKVVR